MKTTNKRIACSPFETTSTTIGVSRGMTLVKQRAELTKLKVQLDTADGEYNASQHVYVRGDLCKHQLAREIYEENGVSFILVPYEFVVAVG